MTINKSGPRTTFMVVAHNNPAHLGRLARALNAPWATILVNIDAKVDERPFRESCGAQSNVHFVAEADRISVLWGGLGLTRSALHMMECAIKEFSPDRLCMLSGVDYALKPTHEIQRVLSMDCEFVRIDRQLHYGKRSVHDDFLSLRHWNDVPILNPRSSPLRTFRRLAMPVMSRLARRPPPVPEVFHGSGWWCVTRAAADWILAYIRENPQFLKWLRGVNCPDEIFIHTLLKMSPRRNDILQDCDRDHDTDLHGIHFIKWGKSSSSPKTLDLDDFDEIRKMPNALFGRKIDPKVSEPLLKVLDEQVLAEA